VSTYLGLDVLDVLEPSREGTIPETVDQRLVVLDNGVGLITVDDKAGMPNPVRSFLWLAEGRTETAAMRAFILARYGRTVPFWMPSYQHDLLLSEDILNGASSATIRWVGYTNQMWSKGGGRRYIALWQPGVAALSFHHVTTARDPGTFTTEGLSLSPAVGRLWPAATTLVMFLKLCRLENDRNVLSWHNAGKCSVSLDVRELPQEAAL